jgi:hypothetical protein
MSNGSESAPATNSASPLEIDRQIAASLSFEAAWPEISTKLPLLISLFAVSFAVGYFYAFDISWFSLFSITEHFVFAIRSLPVAVGATFLLLMFLKITLDLKEDKHDIEQIPKSITITWPILRIVRYFFIRFFLRNSLKFGFIVSLIWLVIVGFTFIYMFYTHRPGAGFGFLLVFICTAYFELLAKFRRTTVQVTYWSLKVTIICMILGYISGHILITRDPYIVSGSSDYTVFVKLKKAEGMLRGRANGWHGRLIFSGEKGVLLYDCNVDQVRLIRWDDIVEIRSQLLTNDNSRHCAAAAKKRPAS